FLCGFDLSTIFPKFGLDPNHSKSFINILLFFATDLLLTFENTILIDFDPSCLGNPSEMDVITL
ncbi:MAG: hypothetical protein Q8P64_15185, partial [Deltaproteobacteria bacterium]|nr:hypothetical protein [Deltaproteobacteria bacterium]